MKSGPFGPWLAESGETPVDSARLTRCHGPIVTVPKGMLVSMRQPRRGPALVRDHSSPSVLV
jgi:hypothetical protein